MFTFFRFIAAVLIMGLITSPLFFEPWFTWPMWIVICLYAGVRYALFVTSQQNNLTLTKSILMRLDRDKEQVKL